MRHDEDWNESIEIGAVLPVGDRTLSWDTVSSFCANAQPASVIEYLQK